MMNWLLDNLKKNTDRECFSNMTYSECYDQVVIRMRVHQKLYNNAHQIELPVLNNKDTILDLLSLLSLGKQVVLFNPNATSKELKAQKRVLKNNQNHLNSAKSGIVLFTSGSTGIPKAVLLTEKMIKHHVKASQKAINYVSDDCWLLTLPLFHVGGLMIVFRSIYNGTSFHLLPKFSTVAVARLINNHTVNMASLVPTMMIRILPLISNHRLRVLLLGGETISDALVTDCMNHKIPVYKTYGMTETCSQVCTINLMTKYSKKSTVGKPIKGFEIKIIDQDVHGIGEITISGPSVFKGYLNHKTDVISHKTGDLGTLDQEGYLTVFGRKDDMLIIGGENVFPQEVEQAIATIQSIEQCAVIGHKDALGVSELIAFVSGDVIVEEVLNQLRSQLSKYKIPKKCYKLNKFPKTASGKLDRKQLMSRLNDED